MNQSYGQVSHLVEKCNEEVLYGTIVAMHNHIPHWKEIPQLRQVGAQIGEQLKENGWQVELGLTDRHRRFTLNPPQGSVVRVLPHYSLSVGRMHAGVVSAGDFYMLDRRSENS